jgi:hypothetical protein
MDRLTRIRIEIIGVSLFAAFFLALTSFHLGPHCAWFQTTEYSRYCVVS